MRRGGGYYTSWICSVAALSGDFKPLRFTPREKRWLREAEKHNAVLDKAREKMLAALTIPSEWLHAEGDRDEVQRQGTSGEPTPSSKP